MIFDADISFNPDRWAQFIASQEPLFDVGALVKVSDGLRQEFHAGHRAGRVMPVLPAAAYGRKIPPDFGSQVAGYDLPCLLSADRETKGTIMLCAQDPLRSGTDPGLTVGTFFGIDNQRLRHSRRHYGVLWELVRRCVIFGYDVWVTDAMKLYVKGALIDPSLHQLCGEVLLDEVRLVKPTKIVAFGNRARDLLSGFGLTEQIIHLRHPTAWGGPPAIAGWPIQQTGGRESRFDAKVQRYCYSIFGHHMPPSKTAGINLR